MSDIQPLRLQFAAFQVDEMEGRLMQGSQPVALPPKAFAVLCALARQPGKLVTKDELLDAVWGHRHVSESVLKTTISELRAALSDDAKQPRYIETASRRGYRFIGSATRSQAAPSYADESNSGVIGSSSGLIGRRDTLDRLHNAWQGAQNGRRQIFWIAGEAGVGKTTLIDAFVREHGDIHCAHGQCVEQVGVGEPYLPVLEALAALCRRDATLPALMRAVAPTWLIQLPWLTSEAERQNLRHELAGATQDRMLRELGELLERYTELTPLVLITEDLHWSDHATVHLMDHIARRRAPARLMWLASFRLAEVISEDHPLKGLRHELRMHRLCEEMVLDSFSEQEVADCIRNRVPETAVTEGFVRVLHQHTDGLPLFVVNVIDDLVSQGTLRPATGSSHTSVTQLTVPESLAGVIEKQIARLPSEVSAMLEAASVCGVEFRPETIGEVLDRDPVWVSERCDELVKQQHWLRSLGISRLPDGTLDSRYAFRHAVYRHVFYQRLAARPRAALHARVARSMERLAGKGIPATPAELALHYELSHDTASALRCYAPAAENALRRFAPTEAMTLTNHALELLPQAADATALRPIELALAAMQGVANAQLLGVSSPHTKRAFERAMSLLKILPQHPLRGMVMHGLGLVLMVRGEYRESRGLGERITELCVNDDDLVLRLSACNLLGQVNVLQGRHLEGRKWLEQGIAVCEAVGDRALQTAFLVDPAVTMYAALAMSLLHLGLADQGRRRLDTAHERAQRLGQPMAKMVSLWFSALFESRTRNLEHVATIARQLRQVVETYSLAQGRAPSQWFHGWAQAHFGQPVEGHKLIREAYDYSSGLGMLSGSTEVLCYAAEALLLAGEHEKAQTQLDEAKHIASRLEEEVYLTQLKVLQGRISLAHGDAQAALAASREAVGEARRQQAPWLELTAAVALCELPNTTQPDRSILKEVRRGIVEGLDLGLVRRADALLAQ
jgi:DNA-binding winged helix-turn-helix (wHTH) protein/tetratricopeptide (TPR) repeat protein